MDPKHDRERDSEKSPGREMDREAPVRRDENEAVPEFERGSDLDGGEEEQDSER